MNRRHMTIARISLLVLAIAAAIPCIAQQSDSLALDTSLITRFSGEVVVSATRAQASTPTTFTTVEREDLQIEDLGLDLPVLLERTPSLVSTSDAGNGVGYTFLRIRGSDQSRINVTINGIPLNDAESQGVFWVNTPDLSSSAADIQIQRGVGTSTNGAGAFGATVNIRTADVEEDAFIETEVSGGSFRTNKLGLRFSTGLLGERFIVTGRASRIASEGYIDRSSARMWSYDLQGTYRDDNTIVHLIHFNGHERTQQAWFGIDSATLADDRTFNPAGTDFGLRDEPYEDEVDDYGQAHYQVHVSQQVNDWTLNGALHYTRGAGFFEQYVVGRPVGLHGIEPSVVGGDTVRTSDVVRRRWLDNHFYGATASAILDTRNTRLTLGGSWNQYDGDHFGELTWARFAGTSEPGDRFYDNNGLKTDASLYAKVSQEVGSRWTLFADLQYRRVSYTIDGVDFGGAELFEDVDYDFFNPKVGATFTFDERQDIYASFALGSREPARQDFLDRTDEPKPEFLRNLEAGYRFRTDDLFVQANYFLMQYKDQLVLTGALNDVGTPIRQNVDRSVRTGVELDVDARPIDDLRITGNLTWAIHEIDEFVVEDADGSTTTFDNTRIAFSPNWIGALNIHYTIADQFTVGLMNKVVGAQFLDNTSRARYRLDPYVIQDLRLAWDAPVPRAETFELSLLVRNLTNREYVSNGYVFYDVPYYYPQAGIHVLAGLRTRF